MEQNYAIIKNGQVINVIVWDGKAEFFLDEGCSLVLAGPGAEPGGTYDGTTFTPIPRETTNG